jgi:hypothetical protein
MKNYTQKSFLIPAGILAVILIVIGTLYFSLRDQKYSEEGTGTIEPTITPITSSTFPSSFTPSNSSMSTTTVGMEDPLVYAVTTDEPSYSQNEPITIYLSVANTTKQPKTFNFTDGCQGTYTIAGFDMMKHIRCLPNATMFTIPGGELRQIKFTHYPSVAVLPVGTYTLRSHYVGYGGSSVQVTITK